MALDFPLTDGAATDGSFTYTDGNKTWYWDGVAWLTAPSGSAGAAYVLKTGDTITGVVSAPTAAAGTSTTQIATTEFVATEIEELRSAIADATPFTWDANTDKYIRTDVADRSIIVQSRMRRCLVTDAGDVTYLDADDSTKLAGDWLRLTETTELSAPYTGTHGAEIPNTELRSLTAAWVPGVYVPTANVLHNNSVWQCIAEINTYSEPAAGTVPAVLDGSAGQVMVEVPLFSIRHTAPKTSKYRRHELSVVLGVVQGGGYEVHPAFVRSDGTFRDCFRVGAYHCNGANFDSSVSGLANATNVTRKELRAAMAARGSGWHQMSYYEYSALTALLISEYQDFQSQRCLGNGASTSANTSVLTGVSNASGNGCANVHTPTGSDGDHVSYRGVENLYGRAWQWTDGFNINERVCYLTSDPALFADDTSVGYTTVGAIPIADGNYIRDIKEGSVFLPDSVVEGSAAKFCGDPLYSRFEAGGTFGWRLAQMGGHSSHGDIAGAFCSGLSSGTNPSNNVQFTNVRMGGRLSFSQ